MVVQGKGYAEVLQTGINTKFGAIGKSLQSIKADQTRMQKEMKVLIRRLFIIGITISVIIVVAFYITKGNFIQSLLNGLASAMAILPEEFPVVLTIFLALGAWRLSKKNVLTRNPSAIETLGSTTVLCTDKTGTITQNKMDIAALYNGEQIIYKDGFDQSKNDVKSLLQIAALASQKKPVDPMEVAIMQASFDFQESQDPSIALVKEYPLSRALLAMTRVTKSKKEESYKVSCKGSPEAIFDLCKLDVSETEKQLLVVNKFAESGYRVLAVADSSWTNTELPDSQSKFD